ncbi:MAG: hypothetical protein M3252_04015, partial [Actinomycetota bacterium]|nr:hypothetical protein [Actinomycetota bacterium]
MARRATLFFPRRGADHADHRHLLGRGQALGPHPGRPGSKSPTAISLFVVPSLSLHTRSTALEESIMTAIYTWDVFSSLDGFGAHS